MQIDERNGYMTCQRCSSDDQNELENNLFGFVSCKTCSVKTEVTAQMLIHNVRMC